MAAPKYTSELQSQYHRLFDTCVIQSDKYKQVDIVINKIISTKKCYLNVASELSIPWYFIGIIHNLECGGNFKSHLRNGDSLNALTQHEPKGRPKTGKAPFTLEVSVLDALKLQKLNFWADWSVSSMLSKLEAYNGFSYRRASISIPTPYLWSFTNLYTKGKFVKDGIYSTTAISKQCGSAALLKLFAELQIGSFTSNDRFALILKLAENLKYSNSKYSERALEFQKLLHLNGNHLKCDGYAGKITSGLVYKLIGIYLKGDPRA